MRQSLGGLLLLVAGALFAFGASMLWMDRVAFTAAPDTDRAYAILGDEQIRSEIATLVAQVDAPVLGMETGALASYIQNTFSRARDGVATMRYFVSDAHARLIGEHPEPVVITGPEQVQMTRNELVALQPDITLPVEEVGSLSVLNQFTGWAWLVCLPASVVIGLMGLLLRPESGEFTRAVALGCGATAIGVFVFGYIVPGYLLPVFSSEVWMGAFPRLAAWRLPFTIVIALVMGALGGLAFYTSSGGGRTRRPASSPLSTIRYREQQRWSR